RSEAAAAYVIGLSDPSGWSRVGRFAQGQSGGWRKAEGKGTLAGRSFRQFAQSELQALERDDRGECPIQHRRRSSSDQFTDVSAENSASPAQLSFFVRQSRHGQSGRRPDVGDSIQGSADSNAGSRRREE